MTSVASNAWPRVASRPKSLEGANGGSISTGDGWVAFACAPHHEADHGTMNAARRGSQRPLWGGARGAYACDDEELRSVRRSDMGGVVDGM